MALKGTSSLRKGPSFGPVSPWNIFCPLWIMFFSFFLEIGWGRKETEVRLLALPCGSGCTCWWRVGARFLGPHLQTLIWCPHSTTWQFSLFFKWYSLLCWYILLGRWGFWLCSPPHNFSPLTEATGGLASLLYPHCFFWCCWCWSWCRVLSKAVLWQMFCGTTEPTFGMTTVNDNIYGMAAATSKYVGDVQKNSFGSKSMVAMSALPFITKTCITGKKHLQMVLDGIHGHPVSGCSGLPGIHVFSLQSHRFCGEDASGQRLGCYFYHQQDIPRGVSPTC